MLIPFLMGLRRYLILIAVFFCSPLSYGTPCIELLVIDPAQEFIQKLQERESRAADQLRALIKESGYEISGRSPLWRALWRISETIMIYEGESALRLDQTFEFHLPVDTTYQKEKAPKGLKGLEALRFSMKQVQAKNEKAQNEFIAWLKKEDLWDEWSSIQKKKKGSPGLVIETSFRSLLKVVAAFTKKTSRLPHWSSISYNNTETELYKRWKAQREAYEKEHHTPPGEIESDRIFQQIRRELGIE